jgi:predicted phosphodiesterase
VKILAVSDEESSALWDFYTPGKLKDYDLIISCGDLRASYLSFLVTMGSCPVFYVHGNHDADYKYNPPEGCDCIDDRLVVYNGVRILGLGGCKRYHPGRYQYTDERMRRRINRLRFALWRAGGVDIVVTHAPPWGIGDQDDPAHQGFQSLVELLDRYQPQYLLHGHVHRSYNAKLEQIHTHGPSQVINVCPRYVLDVPDKPFPLQQKGEIIVKGGKPLGDGPLWDE